MVGPRPQLLVGAEVNLLPIYQQRVTECAGPPIVYFLNFQDRRFACGGSSQIKGQTRLQAANGSRRIGLGDRAQGGCDPLGRDFA